MTNFLIKKFVKDYNDTGNPSVRASYGKLSGFVGIVCNLILFTSKIIIGLISGSVSITADAVNNLSDASSGIISLLGFKMAEKPADTEHPYGHGRYEYLSGLTVAVLIVVIGIELFKSSLKKIIHPSKIAFSPILVLVLVLSVLIKLWLMLFNKKTGQTINSSTLTAAAADSRNDVISTLAVLTSSVLESTTALNTDGWIGAGVAVFILFSGFGLIKDMIDPMLGTAPNPEFIEKIRTKILSYPGVLGMHDLLVHDYGPCRLFVSVHVEMAAEEDVIESHDTIDNIEHDFLKNDGIHMIIHYDPVLTRDALTNELKTEVSAMAKQINNSLSIHDLRVVPGTTHTNVVFDCAAPFSLDMTDSQIKSAFNEKLKALHSDYNCVVTIDRDSYPEK